MLLTVNNRSGPCCGGKLQFIFRTAFRLAKSCHCSARILYLLVSFRSPSDGTGKLCFSWGLNCLLCDRRVDGELAEGLPLPDSGVFMGAEEEGGRIPLKGAGPNKSRGVLCTP